MKKIGILTFHRALNYGAVLQTVALCRTLQTMGADVEVIDYRCKKIENERSLSKRLMPLSVRSVLSSGLMLYKAAHFDRFLKEEIPVSRDRYYINNICTATDKYDAFISGSDQVWNRKLTGGDGTYFLNFCGDTNKKYSFAASTDCVENINLDSEYLKNWLKSYQMISVREQNIASYLEKYLGKQVFLHLDPVFLLKENEWKELFSRKKARQSYVLVYNVPRPHDLFSVAQRIAGVKRLPIKYVTNNVRPQNAPFDLVFPDVRNFLCLFSNASYVITNSFHGTAFSIIFHKKFLVETNAKGTGNNRIETLLNKLGLSNRLLYNETALSNIDDQIHWDNVDNLIANYRNMAKEYLARIIRQSRSD